MTHALSAALAATAPTMSSREIAERTGKRHADVMRDIRSMLEQLGATERSFASSYTDSTGRSLPCFYLPKRECIILVTGYSIPMRAAVVDRWAELEAQVAGPALPNFANPAEAARAWAVEYEAKTTAMAQVEALKPAVR
ncbi:Rha family transcriptional regulator [Methylorubrum populi]